MPLQNEPEDLIIKHLRNELTEEESVALDAWIQQSPKNREVFESLTNEASLTDELKLFQGTDKQAGYNKLLKKISPAKVKGIAWYRVAAAAIVLLMLSVGGYFYFNKNDEKQIAKTEQQKIENDVAPGKSGAILTLNNGKTIILDTAQNGKVLDNFTKSDESISVESTTMQYATLSTPKARTQQLTLVDGSKVWLNSESSIHFPTVFTGSERNVEITGEVYFEIAHNAKMPFKVKVNGMQIEVLGTHFNVNAYDDEALIKTTLLEGAVRITKNNAFVLLKPGQQAQLNKQSELKVIDADVDEAVAWKNGLFSFNKANMQTVMRQLARWYDVEVVFEGKVPDQLFGGEIERNILLSKVLENLEKNGVHFRIEGKKIIVLK